MPPTNKRLINFCFCRSNLSVKRVPAPNNDQNDSEEDNVVFITVCSRTGKSIHHCENNARLRNNIDRLLPTNISITRPNSRAPPPVVDLRIGYYDRNGTWLRDER